METDKRGLSSSNGVHFLFRALRHRNYRLFFSGQIVSLVGTWMQAIALSWLVYRLTGSPFWLGFMVFANQIPAFLLAPLGGVVADRWSRRKILLTTQTLAMTQAIILTVLYYTDLINIPLIMGLTFFAGFLLAVDIPSRHSFVLDMIEKREDLGNAIALNSSVFNGARLLGPSIAGILVAQFGEGVCFLINSVSFLGVLMALLAMRMDVPKQGKADGKVFLRMKEGFQYAHNFAPIRSILVLLGLTSLVPYVVLMPVFATEILGGGPHTYGFLMGAGGFGAFCGAIYLASRRNAAGLGKAIAMGAFAFGASLIVFSFSTLLWLSLGMMVISGFGQMIQMASSNTVLQTISDDDKRGRVMSFYTMSIMGTSTFGSLIGGGLAAWIGAPGTFILSGFVCIFATLYFAKTLPHLNNTLQTAIAREKLPATTI